jgi:hypothetical protein
MRESFYEDYEDVSFDNIYSIINYIKNNYIKFLLLIFVFFIIVVVDHISYINTMILSLPYAMPGSPIQMSKKQFKKVKISKK